ncbi:mitochondrial peptide methionine sulfoxide reductase-like isoform X2 [Sinocyclocheilus grahami]|uniref:mitochondrial peptide methionine sulfoxide reductase-like isoform X2 n=1 Tax=Sinocyclocheilus grahami TaxID=75366 RepID=UPI0007ACA83B|nr:PREDICTED: mitochondrial peptide methionine sulfoxide reductase-like isoform X2 [Sinocyclocheilus grahami]
MNIHEVGEAAPYSSSSSMALARTCLLLQAGAHAAIILIILQLGLRVTVAQLSMANKSVLTTKERSLKGREEKMVVAAKHAANGNPTVEPFPDGMEMIMFGMGCFWGAERRFWRIPGVFSTQVGYAGGFTPNPTYHEVCSGLTGHTEVLRVVFSPKDVSLEKLLKVFWESHDPTQGMAQGNDHGTQYRSAIYTYSPGQQELAMRSKHMYQEKCSPPPERDRPLSFDSASFLTP